MTRAIPAVPFVILFLVLGDSPKALERLNFGTGVKDSATRYLPMMAAEEGGYWKQNGLDGKWIPFQGSTPHMQAVVAGSIDMGMDSTSSVIMAASRGIPVVIVAAANTTNDFRVWVRADGQIRGPQDLKGKKIGVSRFGVPGHTYALAVLKKLGMEREVKFISAGGMLQSLAALKAGVVDAVPLTSAMFMELKVKGEVRDIANAADFLPKEWVEGVIFGRKAFLAQRPELVKRAVKSLTQAMTYMAQNPTWTIEKIRSVSGYSLEAAKRLYEESLVFSQDGRVTQEAVQNAINFLVEFGLMPESKAPTQQAILAQEFAR